MDVSHLLTDALIKSLEDQDIFEKIMSSIINPFSEELRQIPEGYRNIQNKITELQSKMTEIEVKVQKKGIATLQEYALWSGYERCKWMLEYALLHWLPNPRSKIKTKYSLLFNS
jgi:hypothetical protein